MDSPDPNTPKAHQISKLDAARDQLAGAIRLHFHGRNPVAVYALACGAGQIVQDLLKHAGKPSIIRGGHMVRDEHKKMYFEKIRVPENFLKHADRDPEGTLKFHPGSADLMLFAVVSDLGLLTGSHFHEGIIFLSWFMHHNPDMFLWEKYPPEMRDMLRRQFRLASPDMIIQALDGPRIC